MGTIHEEEDETMIDGQETTFFTAMPSYPSYVSAVSPPQTPIRGYFLNLFFL